MPTVKPPEQDIQLSYAVRTRQSAWLRAFIDENNMSLAEGVRYALDFLQASFDEDGRLPAAPDLRDLMGRPAVPDERYPDRGDHLMPVAVPTRELFERHLAVESARSAEFIKRKRERGRNRTAGAAAA